ncbi:hypothetical protein F5887DRAFT_545100 [Amanita rubescens]|nr:hypothetical protein F5887DRAFT_545100 [Amanita rubescens]
MPRHSTAALAAQPLSQHIIPPPSPASASENLALLRTQWKWAAFCQFFSTFAPLFPMNDVSISDIESDLVEGMGRVLPRIMTRLLFTLTYDRKISVDNWQSMLRKQYAKRAPDLDPLGAQPLREPSPTSSEDKTYVYENDPQLESLEQPFEQPSLEDAERDFAAQSSGTQQNNGPDDWFKLSMIQKLDSMHLLTEWHFQHPIRLRTLMKSDDEEASWRIEPVGYDKQSNAYWFIGSDRLWIQRTLPKSRHKIKNTKSPDNDGSQASSGRAKRRRLGKDLEHDDETIFTLLPAPKDRTAKTRAKVNPDTHAQTSSGSVQTSGSRESKHGTTSRPILGTRASARLRGVQQNEWQPIPREWMEEGTDLEIQHMSDLKTGLESDLDELSELTELSDDSYDKPPDTVEKLISLDDTGHQSTPSETQNQSQKYFVEWETICVTLHDWEHIADRFASGSHYSEKALHKYLVNHLVPRVTENLRNIERQKRLEDAITYRKRSSRIALKESEREQALAVTRKRAEEEERLSRARRLQARQQREEERRMRQENARVQRRKERESKEAERERGVEPEQGVEEGGFSNSTDANPSSFLRPPTMSNWELDCEICRRREISPADNTPMVSCGACLKWQHIVCHDLANQRAGLPKHQ